MRGRQYVASTALLLAVAAAGGCSSSEGENDRRAVVTTTRPADAFAPQVHLYTREPAKPISAADFIGGSSLTMANEPCRLQETVAISAERLRMGRDEPAPALEIARLGGPRPYRWRVRAQDCEGHQSRAYATSQHTRPFDTGRPAALRPHEGFYLDLLSARLLGTAEYRRDSGGQLVVDGVPAYYERRSARVDGGAGIQLDYWLLYGLDGYPGDTDAAYSLTNEGDWERVSVRLRRVGGRGRWEPVAMVLRVNGEARQVPWESVELATGDAPTDGDVPTHPVVYAARGNHAPYPDAGRTAVRHEVDRDRSFRFVDVRRSCADCPRWDTWARLLPVRDQPWYGYGGAWGAVGSSSAGSGPLGPSPYSP